MPDKDEEHSLGEISGLVCTEATCRASTSRGATRSGGDYDSDSSDSCSCCSDYPIIEKPCSIVDSCLKLNHKSKWHGFKTFVKSRMRLRVKKKAKAKREENDAAPNEVIIKDSKPASDNI